MGRNISHVLIVRVPICSTSFEKNSQISSELFVSLSSEHSSRVVIDFKYDNKCTYTSLLYICIQFNRELQKHSSDCEKKTFVKCNEILYVHSIVEM